MGRLRLATYALAGVALWISLLRLPAMSAGTSIDDSWVLALAHFFKHDAQAGHDYVFTYGPLGYFMHRTYDADLFVAKFAWELALKAIFALILSWFLARQGSWLARGLFYSAVLAFPVSAEDALYSLMVLLLGVLLVGRPETPSPLLACCALVLATLALTKFTLLLMGVLVVALLAIDLVASGRNGKAWALIATFVAGLFFAWILVGQAPAHLPGYLRTSWDMSAGYTDAMSFDGKTVELLAALAIFALWAATTVSRPPCPLLRRSPALRVSLVGVVMYLFWKSGFVRHDIHAASFFALALPVTFVLPVALEDVDWRARWRVLCLLSAGLLSAACLGVAIHRKEPPRVFWPNPVLNLTRGALGVLDPSGLRQRLEDRQQYLRQRVQLPRLRGIVDDEPVDVFGNHQGLALLNGMNWQPRPGFQSYAAYTRRLAEANAAFFEGPRAPRYVLLAMLPLDDRLPSHEDGPALLRILARYRPLAAEGRYLLLERTAPAARSETRTERYAVDFNQVISLPAHDLPQLVRVEIEKTWWGKLLGLILKTPRVYLNVEGAHGETGIFRLVPSLARSGFLLNPVVLRTEDVIDAYADVPRGRIVRCALQTSRTGRWCYRSIHVEVDTLAALTPVRISKEDAAELKQQLGPEQKTLPTSP